MVPKIRKAYLAADFNCEGIDGFALPALFVITYCTTH